MGTKTLAELVLGFFKYYGESFDWNRHAVCVRLNRPCVAIDKFSLASMTGQDQWYVEDPFDLKHNLAGKCSSLARARVLDEMRAAVETLRNGGGWQELFREKTDSKYFLKVRVGKSVTAEALLAAFQGFGIKLLHFPNLDGVVRRDAFLEFASSEERRRAHTNNEMYVIDCQLLLHYSSSHGLVEARTECSYTTHSP